MDSPLISICIPAYKRTEFLRRLFESIVNQTYRNFDVIVTDDSNDHSVEKLVQEYSHILPIVYSKNTPSLGTPENCNAAVKKANGSWIKLMHDDDWFANKDSLQGFVDAVNQCPEMIFFFSAYNNIKEYTSDKEQVTLPYLQNLYLANPVRLLAKNVIGPPSVTLYKNTGLVTYDTRLKWLVDMDFYIQYLKESKAHFINQPLINIGINELQVTKTSFRVNEVEIPEHFHILKKLGYSSLKDIIVYDAIWRLIRNLNIRSIEDILAAGYDGRIHNSILSMIHHQNEWGRGLLRNGVISKVLMLTSYLINRRRLPDE